MSAPRLTRKSGSATMRLVCSHGPPYGLLNIESPPVSAGGFSFLYGSHYAAAHVAGSMPDSCASWIVQQMLCAMNLHSPPLLQRQPMSANNFQSSNLTLRLLMRAVLTGVL